MTKINFFGGMMTALAISLTGMSAEADNDKQKMARDAVLKGEIAPLSKLLSIVERTHPGDVLKIEMEHEDVKKWGGTGDGKIYIYEIKVLTQKGNLVKLKYDAKSLKLLTKNGINRREKNDREEQNGENNH